VKGKKGISLGADWEDETDGGLGAAGRNENARQGPVCGLLERGALD